MNFWKICPETPPPHNLDRSGRLAWLALSGFPQLAADTLLTRKNVGRVQIVVGNAVRQLNLAFVQEPSSRERCYEVLLEAALNLFGMERRRAGFSDEETESTLSVISQTLEAWEARERVEGGEPRAAAAIQKILLAMKKVLMGQSMVARMGEEIEKGLDERNLLESFVAAARRAIEGNVYFQMVDRGMTKLGNDSATGLRWLRHLGAVQVSSNPVIAARAFEELTSLWEEFRAVASAHPDWLEKPEAFADEITMYGTVTSLLPNVLDFRPIALLSDFHDGMVSLQLNPYKAASIEGSREDALKIYGMLGEVLARYDTFLMGDEDFEGRGRPNVVFKVSAGEAAAIAITEDLNSLGLGTNNTVTYTVAQEVRMTMAAFRGLSNALKMGIPVTQVYMTNMEGRLEDHLREVEAARLLESSLWYSTSSSSSASAMERRDKDEETRIRQIAEKLGALSSIESAASISDKVAALCTRKYLKSLTDGWFVEAVPQESAESLQRREMDMRMAGILVTRRVYELAFAHEATSKWVSYVQQEFGVPEREATVAVRMVDLLPASKRRAEDTYFVLGGKQITNITNTDFPDQQLKVWLRAQQPEFEITSYENSVLVKPDAETLKRLLLIEDFRKAYELTPQLLTELGKAKIQVRAEAAEGEEAVGGIRPEDWSSYGPAIKTMNEFKGAYRSFSNKLVEFAKGLRVSDLASNRSIDEKASLTTPPPRTAT